VVFSFNTYIVILSLGVIIGGGLSLFFERKLIAIGQKRLGISFIGRHG
jgi:NADH:ubiquinone oxidoreductase subunit H